MIEREKKFTCKSYAAGALKGRLMGIKTRACPKGQPGSGRKSRNKYWRRTVVEEVSTEMHEDSSKLLQINNCIHRNGKPHRNYLFDFWGRCNGAAENTIKPQALILWQAQSYLPWALCVFVFFFPRFPRYSALKNCLEYSTFDRFLWNYK